MIARCMTLTVAKVRWLDLQVCCIILVSDRGSVNLGEAGSRIRAVGGVLNRGRLRPDFLSGSRALLVGGGLAAILLPCEQSGSNSGYYPFWRALARHISGVLAPFGGNGMKSG